MLLQSQIKNVTIYTDRALIERVAEVNLTAGEHALIFGTLPTSIDVNSIQVNGGQNSVLQEIKLKDVYLDEIPDDQKKALITEIEELEALIEESKDKINNLSEEKQILQKLSSVPEKSSKKGLFPLLIPEKVKEMLDFYGEKMAQFDESLRKYKRELRKQEEKLNRLREQTKALNKSKLKSEKQVQIKINVKENSEVVLVLSYIVMGAGWKPVYDLRLNSDEKKLNVSYNAIITQKTGEKWEDVKLNLSTAKPQISAIQPQINTWYVDVFHTPPPSPKMKKTVMPMMKLSAKDESYRSEEEISVPAPMEIMEAKVESGASAVSFSIPGTHTIFDNNEEHKIGISVLNFDASLEYNAIPKLSPYAYLTATTTNDSNFPMLSGGVNVFLDNSFVTNSVIKLVAPNQEFKTSLGIDEAVQIEHKLVNKFSKDEGLFSKKSKIIYEYDVNITNNKKIDCLIKVKDQIPISQNQEIKIDLIVPKYKEDTSDLQKSADGIIEWKYTIKPGGKIQFGLKFSVEYPKEIEISGLE